MNTAYGILLVAAVGQLRLGLYASRASARQARARASGAVGAPATKS